MRLYILDCFIDWTIIKLEGLEYLQGIPTFQVRQDICSDPELKHRRIRPVDALKKSARHVYQIFIYRTYTTWVTPSEQAYSNT